MARRLDALPLLEFCVPEMSQGQLRLMLLARALLRRPALLLLDECADGLDDRHRGLFFAELDKAREHSTVIMSTHRPEQLPVWCRHVRWVVEGRLLPDGRTPEETPEATLNATGESAPPSAPIRPQAAPTADDAPLLEVRNATVLHRPQGSAARHRLAAAARGALAHRGGQRLGQVHLPPHAGRGRIRGRRRQPAARSARTGRQDEHPAGHPQGACAWSATLRRPSTATA